MTSNGAEYRFWAYFDTTNQQRQLDDYAPGCDHPTRPRCVFDTDGTINVYTTRAGNPNGYTTNAYTPVGTYTTGWTEFRIVYTSRSDARPTRCPSAPAPPTPWTPLKASAASGYQIPFMSGTNAITPPNGMLFRGVNGANLWLDDVRYSNTGITDPPVVDTTPPSAPVSLAGRRPPG